MASKRNQDKHVQAPSVDWVTKLAQELYPPSPPKGEEWYTLSEIAEKIGRAQTPTINFLKKANVEKKKFMHIGVDGRRVVLVHYRLNES